MRSFSVACFIVVMSSLTWAGPHDADIGQFMKSCLDENESFTKERIGLTNRYIISVGRFDDELGTYSIYDSFILEVNEGNYSDIRILENKNEISGVIADKYALANLTFDSLYPTLFETGEILALAMEFNDSREPQEGLCKLSTGTDKFECYDHESCLRACYTPMCNPVAMGVGWPFIDAIWDFTNETRKIDGNLSALMGNLGEVEDRSGDLQELLDESERSLVNMQESSNRISQNGLFSVWVYSFCYPINFNRTSLITAKIRLKRINERLEPIFSIPLQAENMTLAGSRRAAMLRENLQKESSGSARLSFWDRLSREERNLLRLVAFQASPDMIYPVRTRLWEISWE